MPDLHLDTRAIQNTLENSYNSLLGRRDDAISSSLRLPEKIRTEEDYEHAQLMITQLDKARREARYVRLKCQRPFKEKLDSIKHLIEDEIETPIKARIKTILEQLVELAQSRRSNTPETPAVIAPRISLEWSIESVDRDTLDIEALRSYLTEVALLNAVKKHLAENGPSTIAGVAYREIAKFR